MRNLLLVVLVSVAVPAWGQIQKHAFFYCIDSSQKVVYYSSGKATVKKGLEHKDYYQYGFMKRMGYINRSWEGMVYDWQVIRPSVAVSRQMEDSLKRVYQPQGFTMQKVPMPYPMRPFAGYKKDGTN